MQEVTLVKFFSLTRYFHVIDFSWKLWGFFGCVILYPLGILLSGQREWTGHGQNHGTYWT